jgi:hypothetical protein
MSIMSNATATADREPAMRLIDISRRKPFSTWIGSVRLGRASC